ncbi:hypothetical protein [Actinacidiphila acidipaludis]|uniref:LemA family protein n=1 Tax=Actinacidiphila acidipaludis TaxID=2873382 RepID=A0ABS7QEJ5_9ACTN|nr:hypothetical protein [Streptomyces acidipaludis]MBY8881585.1 hypothetical protein [Streptomyces acidipaludis]
MSANLASPIRDITVGHSTPQATSGWSEWVPLGVIVTLFVAVVGWLLVARHRRQDHTRADLAPISAMLEAIDLETGRLAHSPGTAAHGDFAQLRDWQTRVERAAERVPDALKPALAEVAKQVAAYNTATALLTVDEVTSAYLAATTSDAIPAQWNLELLLGRAQQQGPAHSDLMTAITVAENAVNLMLTSWGLPTARSLTGPASKGAPAVRCRADRS